MGLSSPQNVKKLGKYPLGSSLDSVNRVALHEAVGGSAAGAVRAVAAWWPAKCKWIVDVVDCFVVD